MQAVWTAVEWPLRSLEFLAELKTVHLILWNFTKKKDHEDNEEKTRKTKENNGENKENGRKHVGQY